jgi:fructose-1,6-bisphosphatase/inositol monophosphatase family enzyme
VPTDADFALAAELARDAGDLAARMLHDGLTVERKTSISDVVSAADHAAEQLVVDRLSSQRPDDGLVGEEGASRPGARTWYIDPVDGTYNFVNGLPIWCSALALVEQDGRGLGAVYQPATAELWLGGDGRRTTCNGSPVEPIAHRPLDELCVVTYLHPPKLADPAVRIPLLRVIESAATVRMLGCGSVELAAIAGGRLGVSIQVDTLPWDWLPGALLVRAAGGAAEVFRAHGRDWYVAGSPPAVERIGTMLAE